ncbi:hypothetical protein CsSME_00024115 [Camellia sinensis var. sinensis]
MILDKGRLLEAEQMFRDAGEQWPVIIPEEEICQAAPGTKLAEATKAQLSCDYSDYLALVQAYEGWKKPERDVAGYEYY